MGLEPGDAIAMLLPERRRGVRAVPRDQPGRLLPHPDQLAPRRSGDRVHRPGLRGEGVRRARPLRRARAGRGRRDRLPRRRSLRGRRRHPRVPRLRRAEGGPVPRHARRPHHRHRHELHVGHDRSSEGRAPQPARHRAGGRWPRLRRDAHHVRAPAVRRQRAHRRLAAVPHRGARVRGLRDPQRPHRRRHGQVDARADAAPHRHATR